MPISWVSSSKSRGRAVVGDSGGAFDNDLIGEDWLEGQLIAY